MPGPYSGTSSERLAALINSDNSTTLNPGVDYDFGVPTGLTGDADGYNTSIALTAKKAGKENAVVKYNRLDISDIAAPAGSASLPFRAKVRVDAFPFQIADQVAVFNTALDIGLVSSEVDSTVAAVTGSNGTKGYGAAPFLISDSSIAWNPGSIGKPFLATVCETAAVNGVQFLGEVSNLVTYADLCTTVSLTAGNLNTGAYIDQWLHFMIDGVEIYLSKVCVRNSLLWIDLYNAGLVYGTNDTGPAPFKLNSADASDVVGVNQQKVLALAGGQYKCRLPKLSATSTYTRPADDTQASTEFFASEAGRLIAPLITNLWIGGGVYLNGTDFNYPGDLLSDYYTGELGFVGIAADAGVVTDSIGQELSTTTDGSNDTKGGSFDLKGASGTEDIQHTPRSSLGCRFILEKI